MTTRTASLVTTSSSPSGKWVTISGRSGLFDLDTANAVGTEGGKVVTDPQPQSSYYYGSITLVDDSGTTGPGTGGRDGWEHLRPRRRHDHRPVLREGPLDRVIGSAEATADGLNPSISGVEPAANAVLNEAAPVLRFTVSDAGSGFDTGDFDSHVDLYLVPNVDFGVAAEVDGCQDADTRGCKILDSDLSATSLNEDEMTVQFRSRRDWGDDEAHQMRVEGGTPRGFRGSWPRRPFFATTATATHSPSGSWRRTWPATSRGR